jgi:enolase
MVIQIRIPQSIINTCKECGWNELKTKEYFSKYMREVMEDPYRQFEQDFQMWLEDSEEEGLIGDNLTDENLELLESISKQ